MFQFSFIRFRTSFGVSRMACSTRLHLLVIQPAQLNELVASTWLYRAQIFSDTHSLKPNMRRDKLQVSSPTLRFNLTGKANPASQLLQCNLNQLHYLAGQKSVSTIDFWRLN